jgi:hypothetical protein
MVWFVILGNRQKVRLKSVTCLILTIMKMSAVKTDEAARTSGHASDTYSALQPRDLASRINFLPVFAKLQKATISCIVSACPSVWDNSALAGRIFMKFDVRVSFDSLSIKLRFHYNLTGIMGTLHEDLCILITSGLIFLWMRNVSDKNCRES